MNKGILETDIIAQVGIIVRDINRTAKKYADFFGVSIPDIVITDSYEKSLTEYNGKSSRAMAKLAFFHTQNGLDIELIEPDNNPSTWREFLDKNGEGVHHIAFVIKDMKGKIKKLGEMNMPLIQKGEYSGGRYAYMDSNKDLKVMIELLENDGD